MSDPKFIVRIDGKPFIGWEDIKVVRSLERFAGQFEVTASNSPETPHLFGTVKGGAACRVEIDSWIVLDGYIDLINGTYDEKKTEDKLTGRDRTGDLMDCAATVDGPYEYLGQTLDKVIAKIVKPYNIRLVIDADVGKPFGRLAIQPGETAWEFINRACSFRGILPVSNGVGGLLLTKPAQIRSGGSIIEGKNVKAASGDVDFHERFSLYVVKGQGEALSLVTPEESAATEGRAKDAEITRYRPTVITAENQGFDLTQQKRADWQMKFNRARSKKVTYTVQGWYAGKLLWQPNTLVSVKDDRFQISGDRLISSVTYQRSQKEGTTTVLELMMPDAFDVPAQKQKDDVWGAI